MTRAAVLNEPFPRPSALTKTLIDRFKRVQTFVLPESSLNAQSHGSPIWMKWMLIAAGIYNLAFGIFAIVLPNSLFHWINMEPPRYVELWQCIGMIVGVYGVGYLIAAFNPVRHWPIVLVGFLGKLLGPIGMAWSVAKGSLPIAFGLANVTNDLIWLVPFGLVLMHAIRHHEQPASTDESL